MKYRLMGGKRELSLHIWNLNLHLLKYSPKNINLCVSGGMRTSQCLSITSDYTHLRGAHIFLSSMRASFAFQSGGAGPLPIKESVVFLITISNLCIFEIHFRAMLSQKVSFGYSAKLYSFTVGHGSLANLNQVALRI